MLRRVGLGLVVLGVMVVAAGILLSPTDGSQSGGTELPSSQADEFDSTVFRIVVYENGSARWIVEHRRTLSTADEESQFREFADRFRTQDTETFTNFRVRARTLTDSGTETTGRMMNASDFRREASVDPLGQTSGVIRMSFRWQGFATTDGDTVVVADVFGGGWGIIEDQRLTIQAGKEVVFDEVSPRPDSMTVTENLTASDSVTWFGERQFADERPRVVLVPAGTVGEKTPTPTPTDDDGVQSGETLTVTPGGGNGDSSMGVGLLIVGFVFLLGLGGAVLYYAGVLSEGSDTVADSTGSSVSPGSTDAPTEPAVAEEELLSDEDRVLQLLEENGGRMKQVSIVEETEWSKSKVSMLLSDMEDDGEISKLRVGRENIISLAGEEPDAAGSPFDDE